MIEKCNVKVQYLVHISNIGKLSGTTIRSCSMRCAFCNWLVSQKNMRMKPLTKNYFRHSFPFIPFWVFSIFLQATLGNTSDADISFAYPFVCAFFRFARNASLVSVASRLSLRRCRLFMFRWVSARPFAISLSHYLQTYAHPMFNRKIVQTANYYNANSFA